MKPSFSVALLLLAFAGCGAASSTVATPAQARALARGAVETAESAWLLAANGCVDSAAVSGDKTLVDKCGMLLLPARDALVAAAKDVDAWQSDAGQSGLSGDVACELKLVSAALSAVSNLGVKLPIAVDDAKALADSLVCGDSKDGGK